MEALMRRLVVHLTGVVGAAMLVASDAAVAGAKGDPILVGDPEAPVTARIYLSPTCGFCADYLDKLFVEDVADAVDGGQLSLAVELLHRVKYELWADMVARCTGDFFRALHELIDRRDDWWVDQATRKPRTADEAVTVFEQVAARHGSSAEDTRACLGDRDFAAALAKRLQAVLNEGAIQQVPTTFRDGRKIQGAQGAIDIADRLR